MKLDHLIRKLKDGPCLPCFGLQGELTIVPPHEGLRPLVCESLRSGTLEQFECTTCGQKMARFLALQTSPPPSDKWRYERRAVASGSASASPLGDDTVPAKEATTHCAVAGEAPVLREYRLCAGSRVHGLTFMRRKQAHRSNPARQTAVINASTPSGWE